MTLAELRGTEQKLSLRVFRWRRPLDFALAYGEQLRLWQQVLSGQAGDALMLLEHPPVITFGKSGRLENLLVDKAALARLGVGLFFTDRGGDVTYHGPGQLVAYPIIDLRRRGRDVHRYIHDLEEVIIRTLADFGVTAGRDERRVGVWVDGEKIAAIGVRVRRWVTLHGLAVNVVPELAHFGLINPCGITERGVTSLERLTGCRVSVAEVATCLAGRFVEVFGYEGSAVSLTVRGGV